MEYSPTSSSATNPSLPSSGTPTAAESCASEPQKDGSPACTCTRETFGCSIHPTTPAEWIASQRASLARILAMLERELVSAKEPEAGFTAKSCALLGQYDRATCSWKTSQQSLLRDSAQSLETWPRAGMTVDGRAYQHRQPVPRTTVIGGGALQSVPTPTVNGNYNRKGASKTSGDDLATWAKMWQTPVADDACNRKEGKWNSRGEPKLSAQVKMWPTPTRRTPGDCPSERNRNTPSLAAAVNMWPTPRANDAEKRGQIANDPRNGLPAAVMHCPTPSSNDWKGSSKPGQRRGQLTDPAMGAIPAGGQLNPTWVEWLMGWPIGWTACAASETVKSRSKRQQRGDCSEGLE